MRRCRLVHVLNVISSSADTEPLALERPTELYKFTVKILVAKTHVPSPRVIAAAGNFCRPSTQHQYRPAKRKAQLEDEG